jgi:uncharacterized membrane protein
MVTAASAGGRKSDYNELFAQTTMQSPLVNEIAEEVFAESLWSEIKRLARPILVDITVFLLILVALFLGFLSLRALQTAGYQKERIHTLDLLHYWCYTGVYVLFGLDLLFKITLALFFRTSRVRRVSSQ